MLGIDKETLIEAIQKADVKIFTQNDIEDLVCDLGKACIYDHGKVVWYHKEEDDDYIPKDPRH